MTDNKNESNSLGAYFDAAREVSAVASDTLMARVLEDALTQQPASDSVPVAANAGGVVRAFIRNLGGWPSMAGLATAGITGVFIGVFPPADLSDVAGAYLGLNDVSYLIDMSPDLAFDLSEEAL